MLSRFGHAEAGHSARSPAAALVVRVADVVNAYPDREYGILARPWTSCVRARKELGLCRQRDHPRQDRDERAIDSCADGREVVDELDRGVVLRCGVIHPRWYRATDRITLGAEMSIPGVYQEYLSSFLSYIARVSPEYP